MGARVPPAWVAQGPVPQLAAACHPFADRRARSRVDAHPPRTLQTDCIHPNFCYGCSQFASDVTFLPVLRCHRDRARAIRDQCVEEGREKWAERNDRDIAALEPIIATLEDLPRATDFA